MAKKKLLISPDCRGQPHVQATCWYLYGYGGCCHCYLSLRLHPPHCWERQNQERKMTRRLSISMFCNYIHLQLWYIFVFSTCVHAHTHQPVAEVVFVVPSNKRHGELMSPICIKHKELLWGWRSHFIGAWTWSKRAWRHRQAYSQSERLVISIFHLFSIIICILFYYFYCYFYYQAHLSNTHHNQPCFRKAPLRLCTI